MTELDFVDRKDVADVLAVVSSVIEKIRALASYSNEGRAYVNGLPNELIELVGLRKTIDELAPLFPDHRPEVFQNCLFDGHIDLTQLAESGGYGEAEPELPRHISTTFDTIKRKIVLVNQDFSVDIDVRDGLTWQEVRDQILASNAMENSSSSG